MHLNVDGTILYGVKMEAIGSRTAEDMSIDMLVRVLTDLQQDSCVVINDLLTHHQRGILDMVYDGDAAMRSKYVCMLAAEIRPRLDAPLYLDKSVYENELKQVCGCRTVTRAMIPYGRLRWPVVVRHLNWIDNAYVHPDPWRHALGCIAARGRLAPHYRNGGLPVRGESQHKAAERCHHLLLPVVARTGEFPAQHLCSSCRHQRHVSPPPHVVCHSHVSH
jgi:hypothetical protein